MARSNASSSVHQASVFFLGVFLFLGIPLLFWGCMDLRGFVANPGRQAYALITLLAQFLLAVLVPNPHGSPAPEGARSAGWRGSLLGLQLCPLAIVALAPWCDRHGFAPLSGGEWVRHLGLVFYPLGLFLMHWSLVHLGRYFSVQICLQDGHRLVTDGPYRWIRHPRYLGILLCFGGISLIFKSLVAVGLLFFLFCFLLGRIAEEEAMLGRQFSEWGEYCRRTWKLFPFLL